MPPLPADTPTEGLIALAGATLEYRWLPPAHRPDAPPVVMLHEGLGCVAIWRDLPEQIRDATGCGVLVYSREGYGHSSPIILPRPLDYHTREAETFLIPLLDAFGLARVHLFGHSDGGTIALIAAARYPDRIAGAVTLAAHVFNEEESLTSIRAAQDAFLDGNFRARLKRLHGENVDSAFWGWCRTWQDPRFRDWTITALLAGIRCPLLVIQGADDEYGTLKQVDAIVAGTSGPAEALVLANCGHSPHRDQPGAVLAGVLRAVEGEIGR